MIVIDCKAIWIVELAWLVASLAELGHERVAIIIIITREYLHSIVIVISNEQEISMMVERQAIGAVELAIITAFFLSADREHDSSITIKSIALHPSTNQPLSQRQDRKSKRCDAQAHEERREILQTQQQHQGAARRKRQRSSSNDTTTTKERSKEQHRHSLTKHHSLEPADLPLIHSFIGTHD